LEPLALGSRVGVVQALPRPELAPEPDLDRLLERDLAEVVGQQRLGDRAEGPHLAVLVRGPLPAFGLVDLGSIVR